MVAEPRRLSDRGRYPEGVEGVEAGYVGLASGITVRIVESGSPQSPRVVLVPGWGCGAWIFHDTIVSLAACGFHATAVELKGHGFSDKPLSPDEYTLDSMSGHLIDILDALKIDRALITGHSMGAAIAVRVAERAPHRIRALALAAPVGFAGVRGMWLFRLITPAFAVRFLSHFVTTWMIRTMLSIVYGSLRCASLEDIEEFYAPVKTPGGTTSLRHLLHELDWDRPFPALSVPMLTILGSEDILSPASDAARFAPGDVIIVDGAGHVLFDEAPEIVGSALCRFFNSHPAPYISSQHEQNERRN